MEGGGGFPYPISHIPLIHMPVVKSFYSIQLLEKLFLPLDQITLFFLKMFVKVQQHKKFISILGYICVPYQGVIATHLFTSSRV